MYPDRSKLSLKRKIINTGLIKYYCSQREMEWHGEECISDNNILQDLEETYSYLFDQAYGFRSVRGGYKKKMG